MAILILRGPSTINPPQPPPALPRPLLRELLDCASRAGHVLSLRSCADPAQLLEALRRVRAGTVEAVIVDAGGAGNQALVAAALVALPAPWTQVHVTPATTATQAPIDTGLRLADIHGHGDHGLLLALYIVLDHLGCGDWPAAFHTGT